MKKNFLGKNYYEIIDFCHQNAFYFLINSSASYLSILLINNININNFLSKTILKKIVFKFKINLKILLL